MNSSLDTESVISGDATGMQPQSNMSQEPSESSRTSSTSEQRPERALELQEWTRRVQEFVARHTFCQRIPLFFGDCGQPNPAENIAKGLVGQYLVSSESNLVIRILETEAYLERETALYHWKFDPVETPNFKTEAGTLVLWLPARTRRQLVMTTGDKSCGDVVLLKSCELIIYGLEQIERRMGVTRRHTNRNLLVGPENVAKLLEPELMRPRTGNNNVLDETGGLRLLEKDSTGEIILRGKRALPMDCPTFTYSTLPEADKEYRFALSVTGMRYPAKKQLHPTGDVL